MPLVICLTSEPFIAISKMSQSSAGLFLPAKRMREASNEIAGSHALWKPWLRTFVDESGYTIIRRATSPKSARNMPPDREPCCSDAVPRGSCVTTKGLSTRGRPYDKDTVFSAGARPTVASDIRAEQKASRLLKHLRLSSCCAKRTSLIRYPSALKRDRYTFEAFFPAVLSHFR